MKKGRTILRTVLTAAFYLAAFLVAFGVSASAYIDPSVMSYAIQAIAGVVIAVGAVAGIYWRRARKKINKSLNIDENRNKEVESDDIIVKTEEAKDAVKETVSEAADAASDKADEAVDALKEKADDVAEAVKD